MAQSSRTRSAVNMKEPRSSETMRKFAGNFCRDLTRQRFHPLLDFGGGEEHGDGAFFSPSAQHQLQ